MSYAMIAQHLNGKRITSRSGKPWAAGSVFQIIRRGRHKKPQAKVNDADS